MIKDRFRVRRSLASTISKFGSEISGGIVPAGKQRRQLVGCGFFIDSLAQDVKLGAQ